MEYAGDLEDQLSDEEICDNGEEEEDGGEDEGGKIGEEEELEEGEIREIESPWALLPDVCLRLIFFWLRDRDRVRAALVCRQWHRVVHSPSLWRQRTFNFTGRFSRIRRSELETAVSYVRAYGRYLEDLEIRFSHPTNSMVSRRFQQTLRTFLAALRKTRSRLRTLTVHHMELDRTIWCRSVRNALVRSLTFYLRREGSRLHYLSLRGARFNLAQGLEVLQAVAKAQQHIYMLRRTGLVILNLEDFFSQPLAVYNSPDFATVMRLFRGLTSITLNYRCLSDELLDALAMSCVDLSGRRGSLRSFTVHCHSQEPHAQVIWGDAWARLAGRCPELRVHITVEGILGPDRLSRILLREIPVSSLSLTSCYFSEHDWSAKPALTHVVPSYSNCLQKLTLDMNNSHESLDEELLELVLMCSKLIYLKVWAFLDFSFLHRLLQKRLDKKCILKTIKIRIYISKHETQEEDEMLEDLYSRYRQLIESELSYFVTTYPML
ncbi:F-box only protein 39-like [Chanos chanos]|uniref:F-box only protein 39-like n=1 Tax=Chanos chanos TaxID=29144 RepID=A0A6J2VPI7_CHACN|nr:F-box only protein 39 [Chanos chanos]